MSDTPDTSIAATRTGHMSEAEWAEAKATYELGKATKVDLAKLYGVHRNTISTGLASRGAVYGAKSAVIENATVENAKGDTAKLHEEITAMKVRRRTAIELLDKLQNKAMAEALTASRPLSSQADEFRTLNTMIKNTKMIREELWEIYDLNKDPDGADEIPEFIISEYTPEEIELINRERLGISPEQVLEQVEAAAGEVDDELGALLAEAL